MGLFDLLDPTVKWPVVDGPAPDVNRLLLQFDSPRFGAPIESARSLGRPDEFQRKGLSTKDCALLYARKGLRLRFHEGKLDEVRFLIGPRSSNHPAFVQAKPLAPDGSRLTPEITKDQITTIFGQPDPGGSDDETLQIFHGQGVISDFNFDPDGHLVEWALYPDD